MSLSLEEVQMHAAKKKSVVNLKTPSEIDQTLRVRPWEYQDEKRANGRTYSAQEAIKRARAIVERNEIQSNELTRDYLTHDEKELREKTLRERESAFDFQSRFVMEANRIKKSEGVRGWFKELFSH